MRVTSQETEGAEGALGLMISIIFHHQHPKKGLGKSKQGQPYGSLKLFFSFNFLAMKNVCAHTGISEARAIF